MQVVESDVCFSCGLPTQNRYIFCERCTPAYGDAVVVEDQRRGRELMIFVGTIPFLKVIRVRMQGKLPVKWWMGTDALTMWMTPPGKTWLMTVSHRLKMRILDFAIFQHWVVHPRLIADLQKGGISLGKIAVALHPPKYHQRMQRKPHAGFNILYYYPDDNEYTRWVYGIDVVDEIKRRLNDVNWMRVTGRQDMNEIFPLVDLYIRPSRHDGAPRILLECEINHIPVLYSADGNPDAEEFVRRIKAIKAGETKPE
jgi:hypothetical protein